MNPEYFFTLPDQRQAHLFKLRLEDGFGVDITDFGGCMVSLFVPDKKGVLQDVILGWKNPESYLVNPGYLGALVGRVPNRIGGGKFTLNGKIYQMLLNDREHSTLHGGFGYSHRLWKVESATPTSLTLLLDSPDGDAGYPGRVHYRVRYNIYADHTLAMDFTAATDDEFAPADLTSHTYFNLNGDDSGVCLDHSIAIAAGKVTETDEFLVPTGKLLPVEKTIYDLRNGVSFAEILKKNTDGFDDNFILGDSDRVYRENAVVVHAEKSGITMKLHTNRSGIQFYMGKHLSADAPAGKNGSYMPFHGFCLETQSWPDSLNHRDFPSIIIAKGRPFHGITVLQFE